MHDCIAPEIKTPLGEQWRIRKELSLNNGQNYTGYRSFWQEMEGRKRRYQVLEQNDFNANVDYDLIFNQIDKELSDECATKN